ncbi:MAG: sorbosone dehydrogenase [Thalassospira sp.]|uniref:PQQ-dependent sugar dehydrogenase n=1 Tax=Thalassospira sp. UBA4513 TaxID=1947675 RepID=UPI000C54DAD9|nr:PQQ-dependent sugar dehydrogenase [Thalassospira sp. UBA4513]MBE72787.1 sorbosone dehydrogenase [Thalassospira sp.]|tara:strand:- start:528 stop:1685 length:1158 start_codon:yes stop_codon:yes gene_type:complete
MTQYLRPDFRRQLHTARRWAGRLCLGAVSAAAVTALSFSAQAQQVSERVARVQSMLTAESGYRLSVFAEVSNARTIAVAPELNGAFVGTRGPNLYFVRDQDGDGVAEDVNLIADDFKLANGIAYKPGTLFVADQHRIVSYDLANFDGESLGRPRILFTNLPDERHHGWRYAALSPDGDRLFVAVGAPCNICKVSGLEGTIISIPVNGGAPDIYASGIRNSVGLTFHPETDELWFTDNGGDMLGDNIPREELNRASQSGQFYGYPWYAGNDTRSPQFSDETVPEEVTFPEFTFNAHNAPLGFTFDGSDALVALHGSWNRTIPDGYEVVRVEFINGKPVTENPFLVGFLRSNGEVIGRPVDVKHYVDGSILISDDHASAIWRMVPEG